LGDEETVRGYLDFAISGKPYNYLILFDWVINGS